MAEKTAGCSRKIWERNLNGSRSRSISCLKKKQKTILGLLRSVSPEIAQNMRFHVKEIYFKVALRETSEGQGKQDRDGTKTSLGVILHKSCRRKLQPAPTANPGR